MSVEYYKSEYNRSENKNKRRETAVKKLEAYICGEEKKFGSINVMDYWETKCQPKILKSLTDLKAALEEDKFKTEEAYEYLRKSNKAMKKIMAKLREEMKLSRENIRAELIDFEDLNTDRLLKINPKDFLTVITEKGK